MQTMVSIVYKNEIGMQTIETILGRRPWYLYSLLNRGKGYKL